MSSAALLTFCTGGDLVGYAYARAACDTGLVEIEYLDLDSVSASSLPSGWELCGGTTTGGGGSGESVGTMSMVWQQGTFEDSGSGATAWPDGGALATVSAERWTSAPIAGTFSSWAFEGIKVTVHNVDSSADVDDDITVTLQDDTGLVYATVTIASGTSPDSPGTAKYIQRSATGTETAVLATRLQWLVESAPTANDFWVEALAVGILS